MDDFFNSLIALLPPAWRPWVVLACIVVYLITKIRSMQKSKDMDQLKQQLADIKKCLDLHLDAASLKPCPAVGVVKEITSEDIEEAVPVSDEDVMVPPPPSPSALAQPSLTPALNLRLPSIAYVVNLVF